MGDLIVLFAPLMWIGYSLSAIRHDLRGLLAKQEASHEGPAGRVEL